MGSDGLPQCAASTDDGLPNGEENRGADGAMEEVGVHLAQFLPPPVHGAVLGAASRRPAGGRVVDPGPGAAAPSFYRAMSSG